MYGFGVSAVLLERRWVTSTRTDTAVYIADNTAGCSEKRLFDFRIVLPVVRFICASATTIVNIR